MGALLKTMGILFIGSILLVLWPIFLAVGTFITVGALIYIEVRRAEKDKSDSD